MIRHVVMFKFRADVTPEQEKAWLAITNELPKKIEFVRTFSVGRDQLHLPRSYTYALVADMDTLDDVKRYAVHPAHVPVAEMSRSI